MSRRHVLAVLLPLALGVPLTTSSAGAATVNPGSIAGRATTLVGAPLEGIQVEVVVNHGYGDEVVGQDRTDAQGRYRVDDITEGRFYKVRFVDPEGSYASEYYDGAPGSDAATYVPVERDEVTRGADATLEPAASISGRIVDPAGQPLSGVQVELYVGHGPHSMQWVREGAITDSDGRYLIRRLTPATYHLEFTRSSYTLESWRDQPYVWTSTPLVVGAGQQVRGLDVVVGAPDPPVTLPPTPVVNRVAPSIDGRPRVGELVTAHAGRWTPASVGLMFRWYADGHAIPGATHRRLLLTEAQRGQHVLVRVTARAPGHAATRVVATLTDRVRP